MLVRVTEAHAAPNQRLVLPSRLTARSAARRTWLLVAGAVLVVGGAFAYYRWPRSSNAAVYRTSPLERNRPKDLDELYRHNDVELFDLQTDPGEMTNLAADRTRNADLISTMSAKLEAAIEAEIGVDDGREMPAVDGINWAIDRIDM